MLKWYERALSVVAAVVLASLFINGAAGYTIVGNSVIEETAFYRIEQYPHTLNDITNYAFLKVKNKAGVAANIDVAFGFDTDVIRPSAAQLWALNAPHTVTTLGNVSKNYVCAGNFNYTVNPKFFWCYDVNGTLKFEHDFVNGWIANKTAEWFEWGINGSQTIYYDDWVDVSGAFYKDVWRGKTWFYRKNVLFEAGEEKQLKIKIEVKPNTAGKYDLFAKLSRDSFQEAFDSGRFVLLDPWFNASWTNRKCIIVTDGWNTNRLDYPIVVNVTGLTLATSNCSQEIRVLANYSTDTVLGFGNGYVISNASGQTASAGNQWCEILIFVNQTATANATYTSRNTTNYCFYYNNAAAENLSYTAKTMVGAWKSGYVDVAWTGKTNVVDTLLNANGNGYINVAGSSGNTFGYNNSASGGLDITNGMTQIYRFRTNNVTSKFFLLGMAYPTGTIYVAALWVNETVIGVEWFDRVGPPRYNHVVYASTTGFHTYTLTSNANASDYSVYIDGVWMFGASNYSLTGGTNNQLIFGSGGELDSAWNFDLDWMNVYSGQQPPLNYSLAGVKSVVIASPLNASYVNSSILLNFTAQSSNLAAFPCWLFNGSTTFLGSITNNSPFTYSLNENDGVGFSNVTCQDSSGNFSSIVYFTVESAFLNVSCLDESTGALITCGIAASNTTNYTSVNSYFLKTKYPVGSLTLTANNSGYYNRSSLTTFTGVSNVFKSIYLLNTSTASVIFVRFHIQTVTGSPVTDATVTISKYFGATLTELTVKPTDGFGLASFYLDSATTYVVNVVSPTFGSASLNVNPAQNDYYITLGGGSGGIGNYTYSFPPWCYDNVSASYIPISSNLFLGVNYVNQTISASDSQLAFWGWNFYVNGSLVSSVNNSNASGGVLSYLLYYNASNATGNASFHVFWARNNVSGACDSYVFLRVFNMSGAGTGLVQAMQDIKSGTSLPAFGFQLLVLLFTAILIAFAARYTAVGGAIIGVIVLSIFALGNWISWEIYLLLAILGLLGSYFIFSRGY